MAEKRIVVPEGMLNAAWEAVAAKMKNHIDDGQSGHVAELYIARIAVEAALLHMSENPIVPTDADVMGILQARVESGHITGQEYCAIPPATVRHVIREWQRRMFLDPEPEEIKDLLMECDTPPGTGLEEVNNRNVIEAFRRGQKSAKS